MMTDDEIIAEVKKYPAVTVVLTGGEPSLWIDDTLIDRLHEAGKYVTVRNQRYEPLARICRLGDLLAQTRRGAEDQPDR